MSDQGIAYYTDVNCTKWHRCIHSKGMKTLFVVSVATHLFSRRVTEFVYGDIHLAMLRYFSEISSSENAYVGLYVDTYDGTRRIHREETTALGQSLDSDKALVDSLYTWYKWVSGRIDIEEQDYSVRGSNCSDDEKVMEYVEYAKGVI